jgi:leucyl aminopeptidase
MKIKINVDLNVPKLLSKSVKHHLIVVNSDKSSFLSDTVKGKLKRLGLKLTDLESKSLSVDDGNNASITIIKSSQKSTFEVQTILRKALKNLLEENPKVLNIICESEDAVWNTEALYTTLINSQNLPSRKSKSKNNALGVINFFGKLDSKSVKEIESLVEGNTLSRILTMTPPNDLTPTIYRKQVKKLSAQNKWKFKEFTMPQLKKMGAGAFVSVGQGSDPQDAAIVHLTYQPKNFKKHITLVGKGICFDTGGHNLKPSKYMFSMHEDMNGSATALGILQAASMNKLPVKIDCWLAIAQNHIGPKAYKQNDVVKALNGKTIEIIHTDAEGRMVLADTLTLASKEKSDAILDFATLTGCMAVAMGDRYSGIFSNRPELACMAVGAGQAAGERVSSFPMDEDYEEDIESDIADIKQCTLEGGPDHIHAARFLLQFLQDKKQPWLHVDLSSSNTKGGLGAAMSNVNGFGVRFGYELIKDLLKK